MSAQTQFFKAVLLIGGSQYPVMPAATLNVPKNFIVPPIIGNNWQLNYCEGVQTPVVDFQMVCRDVANEVLSSTFLNYFLTRSNDAAFDTPVIGGGIAFWDGRSGFTIGGAKADSFTISVTKGGLITFTVRFVGTSLTPLGAAPIFTAWTIQPLLSFANVNLASSLANIVWQYGLSFSNNHTPDLSLNGSVFPAAMNAGLQVAGLNIMVQAVDTVPDNNPTVFVMGNPTFTTIAMTITGANVTRTFTVNNAIDQTANNRTVPPGRVMRAHTYVCLGQDGQTTPPLSIS